MVTILDEVQISVKHRPQQRFALHPINGLVTKAAAQGWILEYGTEPNEGIFALFRDDLLCPAEGDEP